jgi:hypothetical protein
VTNVSTETTVEIYTLAGALVHRRVIRSDADFALPRGIFVVKAVFSAGRWVKKVVTH